MRQLLVITVAVLSAPAAAWDYFGPYSDLAPAVAACEAAKDPAESGCDNPNSNSQCQADYGQPFSRSVHFTGASYCYAHSGPQCGGAYPYEGEDGECLAEEPISCPAGSVYNETTEQCEACPPGTMDQGGSCVTDPCAWPENELTYNQIDWQQCDVDEHRQPHNNPLHPNHCQAQDERNAIHETTHSKSAPLDAGDCLGNCGMNLDSITDHNDHVSISWSYTGNQCGVFDPQNPNDPETGQLGGGQCTTTTRTKEETLPDGSTVRTDVVTGMEGPGCPGSGDQSSEDTAQQTIDGLLDGLVDATPTDPGIEAAVETAGAATLTTLDQLATTLESGQPTDGQALNNLEAQATNLAGELDSLRFIGGSCTPLVLPIPVGSVGTAVIDCADTQALRDVLAWVVYLLTAIYLFHLVTTKREGA